MTDIATARYGWVARTFHWATVVALISQFVLSYSLDGGSGRGRGRGRSGESGRGRGRGGDLSFGDDPLLTAHVILGVAIIVTTLARWWWRRRVGLPPWAPGLSAFERRWAHVTERLLYALLIVVPATGIALVLGDDDLLPLHVAGHIALYVVIAGHVGSILTHQLRRRDRLIRRML
jgi:cytochrome b561